MGDPPSEAGADQLRATWPLPAVAVRPVGAPGTVAAGAAPPRNRPDRTAFTPATRVTVTRTEPPAPTLTGTCIQAPPLNAVVMLIVVVVVPCLTDTVSRRGGGGPAPGGGGGGPRAGGG